MLEGRLHDRLEQVGILKGPPEQPLPRTPSFQEYPGHPAELSGLRVNLTREHHMGELQHKPMVGLGRPLRGGHRH